MTSPGPKARAWAILEVVLVFALAVTAVGLTARSPWGGHRQELPGWPFLEYLVLMSVPLAVLLLTRRSLASHGLSARGLRENVHGALLCMVPYAGAHVVLSMVQLPPLLSAAVSSVLAVAVLLLCSRLLPSRAAGGGAVLCMALPMLVLGDPAVGRAAAALIFYVLFLGPGEEILFRGYVQSRLNQAFGCPWTCRGVSMGWGLPMTAALFGVFHLLNLPELFAGRLVPDWGGCISATAWGLFFGYLREWSGSVVAPALVHGVPQGIAAAFMEW
jgi:uncharacterized protein